LFLYTRYMQQVVRIGLLGVLYLWLSPQFAQAATLYIDPPQATLNRGDAVTMTVRLDTDEMVNECINAVDGIITYDAGLSPVDVSVGD